jgi:hypothetical protein
MRRHDDMTWSDRTGLSGIFPASAQVSSDRIDLRQETADSAAMLAAIDGQARIGQLLGDAVNLVLKAGLQLSSVHCRLKDAKEQQAVDRVTGQLDAALVEIRHLSVRLALAAQVQENGQKGSPHRRP